MTLERLTAIIDAYGANPERWPDAERAGGLALLARSPEARAVRDAAAMLDALLDRVPAAASDPELAERVIAQAPRAKVVPLRPKRRLMPVAAVALAAAATLAVWLVRRPAPVPTLDPAIVAELGEYETPTDALASSSDFETVGDVPVFGCDDPDVDCGDADLSTPKPAATGAHRPKETLA